MLHVAIRLNVSNLYIACQKYEAYAHNLTFALRSSYKNFETNYKLNNAIVQIRTRLSRVCETPTLFYTLSLQNGPAKLREERGAAVVGAIAATAAFGLYNQYQLTKLDAQMARIQGVMDRVQDNMLIIEATNARISDLSNDVTHSYDTILTLIDRIASTQTAALEAFHAVNEFANYVDTLTSLIHTFETGFTQLNNHKLSLNLLTPSKLVDIWQDIHSHLSDDQQSLFRHPFDLLNLPATYTVTNDMFLNVFLHVPKAATTFQLYKYVPFPIVPDDIDMPLIVKPKHNRYFLAITVDQQNHIEFSESELAANCYNFNHNYICDDVSFFFTKADATCLSSLYMGQDHSLESLCSVSEFLHNFASHSLSRNEIFVYSKKPTAYKILCPQNSSDIRGHTLVGHDTLTVEPECRIDASDFHIQSTAMSYLKTTISFPVLFNFTRLAGGKSLSEIKLIKQQLQDLDISPENEIRNMIQQARNTFKTVQHFPHLGSNLVMTGLGVAFVMILFIVCCCSQCLRREIKLRVNTLMHSLYAIANAQEAHHTQQRQQQPPQAHFNYPYQPAKTFENTHFGNASQAQMLPLPDQRMLPPPDEKQPTPPPSPRVRFSDQT